MPYDVVHLRITDTILDRNPLCNFVGSTWSFRSTRLGSKFRNPAVLGRFSTKRAGGMLLWSIAGCEM
jgi:hypothetical protein